jgi:hypothetical protein
MVSLYLYFVKGEQTMNSKFTNFIKTTKGFIGKHSPEILTGIGIAGMVTTTVLAVKATPKALRLIEEKKLELNVADLTIKDTIKAAWKPYIPATLLCTTSISCLIGASAVNYKRNAALATAYAISERTLLRYRDKVIDTLGDKKEKEIREKVAQDEVTNKPVSNSQIIVTSKGHTLCMDSISGRYFESDIDIIQKKVNYLNRRMLHENYISLDEFYYELGLEPTKNASNLGWNLDQGLIELDFSACLTDDGRPCVYVDYAVSPRYEFDKLM